MFRVYWLMQYLIPLLFATPWQTTLTLEQVHTKVPARWTTMLLPPKQVPSPATAALYANSLLYCTLFMAHNSIILNLLCYILRCKRKGYCTLVLHVLRCTHFIVQMSRVCKCGRFCTFVLHYLHAWHCIWQFVNHFWNVSRKTCNNIIVS